MAKEPSSEDAGLLRLSALKSAGLRSSCVEGLRERTTLSDAETRIRGFFEDLESLKRSYERAGKTAKAEAIRQAITKLKR